MEKTPEILALRQKIREKANGVLETPAGFEALATKIFNETHERVSTPTLKRFFGYIAGTDNYQTQTLDILANYVGFQSYDIFCKMHDGDSGFNKSKILQTNDLQIGSRIRLTWYDSRIMVVRYLGDTKFVIEEVVNSKNLKAGYTFKCLMFVIGEPANLCEINDCSEHTYTIGKIEGLTSCNLL